MAILWYSLLFSIILIVLVRKVFKKERISRLITSIAAIVFWVAYGILLSRRVIFMIHEGGMELRDGYGSPMAFLLGMMAEIFILALPALAFTLLSIFYAKNKTTVPSQCV